MIPAREVLFARENQWIKSALGAKAPSIEHVGSTSVPGLPARPIIDILPSGERGCFHAIFKTSSLEISRT